MAGKMGLHVAYGSNNESDERDESVDLDCLLPEAVCAVPRLRKLPPGPSRSLGGYLDYEGWPDRERFMELDRALQHAAQERHNSGGGHADLDDPQALPAVRQRGATLDEGNRSDSRHYVTADYPEKRDKYRADPSFVEIIRKLEDLPLRRL